MALDPVGIKRLQRWDVPFGPQMTEADVDYLLTVPPLNQIDPNKFPAALPLRGILQNDARLLRYQDGDLIVRRGDYGNSAFFILSGTVRVELDQLPASMLGRQKTQRKGFFQALAQLWSNHRQPEVRQPARDPAATGVAQRGGGDEVHIFLQDVPAVLSKHRTAQMDAGQMFGELAALGRTPRTATVFAEGDVRLLEMRWQGLRDIMRRDDGIKRHVDRIFRERALTSFLRATPLFQHLDTESLEKVAAQTQFETHGRYDRAGSLMELATGQSETALDQEPTIAEEGHYPNGLLMVRSGLVRLSRHVNHGHRTLNYLVPGQTYGIEELTHNWRNTEPIPWQYTLRAVGYVNMVLVPTAIIEEFVFRRQPPDKIALPLAAPAPAQKAARATPRRGEIETELLEFLVEKRFINGTASMVIDLNRCTRCDDCVRACSAAHDNNPRFLRHGPTHGHHMVAHACMHCLDPVCMIECPTGAIHRDPGKGLVVINDATCIGCSACAKNCPYEAIRMVEIRDASGGFLLDQTSQKPIAKATKCDLCIDQLGGPACQRACPHDALLRVDMRDTQTLANWLNR
jgi:Fe-S-cluster-containing dehydrogenase component/CRP-like cAMP-binding protein